MRLTAITGKSRITVLELHNTYRNDLNETLLRQSQRSGNLPWKCFVQGFGAVLHMKFVVDAVNVFLNRLLADK